MISDPVATSAVVTAARVDTSVLLVAVAASAIFFGVVFVLAWQLMQRFWPPFQTLSKAVQADSAARVGSSIHAVILVPMLLWFLANTQFDAAWEPVMDSENAARNLRVVSLAFCFSIGYFILDGATTVIYKMPMWQVFTLHHVLAAAPYCIFLFIAPCHRGSYILAAFLCVESTNVSLNNQVLLERAGRSESVFYAANLYTTFTLWLVTRVYIPCRNVYLIHWGGVWSALNGTEKWCLGPSVFCAWFIVLFCLYAFVFLLCKELWMRWSKQPEIGAVCKEKVSVLELSPDVPMSPTERAVTCNSPTHVALYNARKGMHEVEDTFDRLCHSRAAERSAATDVTMPHTAAAAGGGGGATLHSRHLASHSGDVAMMISRSDSSGTGGPSDGTSCVVHAGTPRDGGDSPIRMRVSGSNSFGDTASVGGGLGGSGALRQVRRAQ